MLVNLGIPESAFSVLSRGLVETRRRIDQTAQRVAENVSRGELSNLLADQLELSRQLFTLRALVRTAKLIQLADLEILDLPLRARYQIRRFPSVDQRGLIDLYV